MTVCDCLIPAGQAVSVGCGNDELQAVVSPPWLEEQAGTLGKKKIPFACELRGHLFPAKKSLGHNYFDVPGKQT